MQPLRAKQYEKDDEPRGIFPQWPAQIDDANLLYGAVPPASASAHRSHPHVYGGVAYYSGSTLAFQIANSTASIVVFTVGAVAEVAGAAAACSPDSAPEEKALLAKSLAQLGAFSLEPEQPTDRDIVGKPVYRFPNR